MSVVTRWWWLRHAPIVTDDPHRISGQLDVPCDTSDTDALQALVKVLPSKAVWVASHLLRTHQTAEALIAAGAVGTALLTEPDLAEQDLGSWQGMNWDEVYRVHGAASQDFWRNPGHHSPPGGESFTDVITRVGVVVDRMTREHAGRDIVAVAHGGSIRAAVALALELSPHRALALQVDTLSLTRLDHVEGSQRGQLRGTWRINGINWRPY